MPKKMCRKSPILCYPEEIKNVQNKEIKLKSTSANLSRVAPVSRNAVTVEKDR